nr:Serine/threonine-protein kinase Nek2 [Polyrhizophydium stewartii]
MVRHDLDALCVAHTKYLTCIPVFLDKLLNVKLGDFGLSRTIENPDVDFAKTYVGTPFYMSPVCLHLALHAFVDCMRRNCTAEMAMQELVDESRYNAKSDIWALGGDCVLYANFAPSAD